uniref:Purine nucleoside phosphorylase n=1 Tax=Magnetococcus massalia (strain MO-1) TaxID=451514 RepID=A0A1S7LEW6_MAGMO|nr:conserved protein of unknown function [Candidatus Magnetococcus massalia]
MAKNRTRIQAALPAPSPTLIFADQIHGADTEVINQPPSAPPQADALVTTEPGWMLCMMTADCMPVLLADPDNRVIGAAHAGWRGAHDGILESCIETMEQHGASREKLHILIGPCIRQPSYEVDGAFYAKLVHERSANSAYFEPVIGRDDKWLFNLPAYAKTRLQRAGVVDRQLFDCGLCTYREEEMLFSHRRATHRQQVPCGRQLSGIYLHG